MKRTACLIACIVGCAFAAAAQSFLNLDFEGANGIGTNSFFIDWSLAIPDWQHSSGANVNNFVNHVTPQGGVTQYYFLVDAYSTSLTPLDGNYSAALASGYYGADGSGGFIQAYLAQTGLVPSNAVSFRILASSNNFAVLLDSTMIPMVNLGGEQYGGDIPPSFAGTIHALRVMNTSSQAQDPVELDDLNFSSSPIPEPATMAITASGLAAWLAVARRRR